MELKDFVKNVIVEISQGVLLAKNELVNTDVLINPITKNGVVEAKANVERTVQNIEFDVSVSVNEEKSNESAEKQKVGLGITVVSVLGLGYNNSSSESNNSSYKNSIMNRIKFSIPISFPTNTELEEKKIKVRASLIK